VVQKIDIPRLNTNPEVRAQLLTSFIDTYLPQPHYLRDSTGRSLLQSLPGLTGGSALLEKAAISVSAAFLAKQNQDEWLLRYSSKLYGNILKTLHGKITSGTKLGQDILYTTIVLQLYEVRSDLALSDVMLTNSLVDKLRPAGLHGMGCPCPGRHCNLFCPRGGNRCGEAISSAIEIRDSQS
jgi:hypothetical protein